MRGFSTIWIVLGAVIIMTLSGAYYFSKSSGSNNPSAPLDSPSSGLVNSPDETSIWKTYANIQAGFSFKYPPNLRPVSNNEVLVNFLDKEGTFSIKESECERTCPSVFSVTVNTQGIDFKKYQEVIADSLIEEIPNTGIKVYKVANVKVGGIDAVQYSEVTSNTKQIFTVLVSGNKFISIYTPGQDGDQDPKFLEKFSPTYDQILSTLKLSI